MAARANKSVRENVRSTSVCNGRIPRCTSAAALAGHHSDRFTDTATGGG